MLILARPTFAARLTQLCRRLRGSNRLLLDPGRRYAPRFALGFLILGLRPTAQFHFSDSAARRGVTCKAGKDSDHREDARRQGDYVFFRRDAFAFLADFAA